MLLTSLTQQRDALRELLAEAGVVVGFTGAGVSTECGIPDFRSPGSPWLKNQPIDFDLFISSEEMRREAWRRKFTMDDLYRGAQPGRRWCRRAQRPEAARGCRRLQRGHATTASKGCAYLAASTARFPSSTVEELNSVMTSPVDGLITDTTSFDDPVTGLPSMMLVTVVFGAIRR